MKKYILFCVVIIFLNLVGIVYAGLPARQVVGIAQLKLDDLLRTEYWSHTNSNGCDLPCRLTGLTFSRYDENLSLGTCDIRSVMAAWEASPSHKAVLDSTVGTDQLVIVMAKRWDGKCYTVLNSMKY